MDRRNFVMASATALGLIPMLGFRGFANSAPSKPAWLLDWITINDQQLVNYKPIRVTDPANKWAEKLCRITESTFFAGG